MFLKFKVNYLVIFEIPPRLSLTKQKAITYLVSFNKDVAKIVLKLGRSE